ncbi:hypothetical protein [Arenimonas sp. GDDSR-1]|uniref:hypothetical protein n=1 Tax=Arenimonas sp. GDDSR-1 TaxID=2950125 RepID=UPI002630DCEF|nr:hypothetical protein [Arenimonas sp. GDDSR-1]
MSEAYQELLRGFTIEARGASVELPSDVRSIGKWVEVLPRTDLLKTAELLGGALSRSLFRKNLGATRFNLMEALRPAVVDCIKGLDRQFLGSPLPLISDRLVKADHALFLHHAMAESYRRAVVELCHPEGDIPMMRSGNAAACIAHSLWHYQQVLLLSWKLYRTPPAGIWSAMQACYRYAVSVKLNNQAVEDGPAQVTARPHDLFVQTVLLALVNPLAFSPPELEQIKAIADALAPRCTVCAVAASDHSAQLPRDEGSAETAAGGFLEFDAFYHVLTESVSANGGMSPVLLPDGRTLPMRTALVKRMLRALGQASARSAARIYGEYRMDTVVGLSGVHFFAAGRIDFETYIQNLSRMGGQGISTAADWLDSGETPSHRMLEATVLDHSLGGYRLQWDAGQAPRARIGEVVGLNGAAPGIAEPDWMLGVIRWLRYEADGAVTAGIELLTRRCTALALRPVLGGHAGQLLRALEIQPLDEGLPRAFLISGRIEQNSPRLEVLYGFEPYRIEAPRGMETVLTETTALAVNIDYTLLIEQN